MTNDALQYAMIGAGVAVYVTKELWKLWGKKKNNGNSGAGSRSSGPRPGEAKVCVEHKTKLVSIEQTYAGFVTRFEDFMRANSNEHSLIMKILNGGRRD